MFFKKNKKLEPAPKTKQASASNSSLKRKFTHSIYSTIIICVFIAVVIVFNIIATVLAERYPLSIDLTASGDFTISEKNADYVKKIARDELSIEIIVCCDETQYTDGTLSENLPGNIGYYDVSQGSYFKQNMYLLKEYARINKAVSVEFIAPSDPSFGVYTAKYTDEDFSEGDILIESSFKMNGENVERFRHLTFEDLFEISVDYNDYYSSMYYQYYGMSSLVSNNIETAVTSAIYSLTSDKVFQVAFITHNSGISTQENSALNSIRQLEILMGQNNYQFTEISNLNEQEIPQDADVAIIATPYLDYNEDEMKILDDFLENDGKRGKTLFYVASADQADLPNLNEFLAEWGFQVCSETRVFETNADNRANYLTKLTETSNNFTGELTDKDYAFYSMNDVPIIQKEPNGQREYTNLLTFSEDAVGIPLNATSVDEAESEGPYVALGICKDTVWDDDANDYAVSTVMICSSPQMIALGNTSAKVGNIKAIINTLDTLVGKETSDISFDSRKFVQEQFETLPSDSDTIVMQIIFIGLLPAALLACGITVWIRRRRS